MKSLILAQNTSCLGIATHGSTIFSAYVNISLAIWKENKHQKGSILFSQMQGLSINILRTNERALCPTLRTQKYE